jgi:hypothetical protein
MADGSSVAVPPNNEGARSGIAVTGNSRWNHVKQVFEAALEQSPDERKAFLRQRCGEDTALHAEVESLLAAHEQAGSFAERPAFAVVTQSTSGSVGRVLHSGGVMLKSGDRLGPY